MSTTALLNVKYGIVSQIIKILLQFAVRRTFIYYLGVELLGVHSLFTSILSMLAMTELGVGSAIAFSLYGPLAQNNTSKVAAIMCLFRKVYRVIGVIILLAGCALLPFVSDIVNTAEEIPYLEVMFFMVLLKTSLTYLLFAYSQTLLIAAECKFKVDKIVSIFNIVTSLGEILIIVLTQNFILYLLVEMVCLVSQQYLIYRKTCRQFPEEMSMLDAKLSKNEKREIWKNVYGLSISKISGAVLGSIDSVVISVFISTTIVGYFVNYSLVQTAATTIISIAFTSVTANVGRKFAEKAIAQSHFYLMFFMNFIICGTCTILYFVLINDFIALFFGKDLLLSFNVVCAISLNMFITYMSLSIQVFKDASGIFWYGKYRPLATCILNVVFSLLLVKPLGIAGVVLATVISRILTTFWYDPMLVFKYAFNGGLKKYFLTYTHYFLLTSMTMIVLATIFNISIFNEITITHFISKILISISVIILIFYIGTIHSKVAQQSLSIIRSIIHK